MLLKHIFWGFLIANSSSIESSHGFGLFTGREGCFLPGQAFGIWMVLFGLWPFRCLLVLFLQDALGLTSRRADVVAWCPSALQVCCLLGRRKLANHSHKSYSAHHVTKRLPKRLLAKELQTRCGWRLFRSESVSQLTRPRPGSSLSGGLTVG